MKRLNNNRLQIIVLLSIFFLLTPYSGVAQESDKQQELERLELQLGVIQGVLKMAYHTNPFDYEEEELYNAFES